jgi:hypothetical protein
MSANSGTRDVSERPGLSIPSVYRAFRKWGRLDSNQYRRFYENPALTVMLRPRPAGTSARRGILTPPAAV